MCEIGKVVHGKRTPISAVRWYAKQKGGKLLSQIYINMLHKLSWQCKKGHKFETTFNHVKNRGQWCPICGLEKCLRNMRETFKKPYVREKISCGHQGIAYEQFNGFVSERNEKIHKLKRHHIRWRCDLNYKLKINLRNRLLIALKNNQKSGSAVSDLGCSVPELKQYLESKFQPGMTWDNWSHSGWHIDHIKPLSRFNLSNREELLKACHYSNLQPLWAKDNLAKKDKYE